MPWSVTTIYKIVDDKIQRQINVKEYYIIKKIVVLDKQGQAIHWSKGNKERDNRMETGRKSAITKKSFFDL